MAGEPFVNHYLGRCVRMTQRAEMTRLGPCLEWAEAVQTLLEAE